MIIEYDALLLRAWKTCYLEKPPWLVGPLRVLIFEKVPNPPIIETFLYKAPEGIYSATL